MNTEKHPPRILVAIDFSDATERVVETAAHYAQALGGTLHLLHVREPGPMVVPQESLGVLPMMQPIPVLPVTEDKVDRLAPWLDRLAQRGLEVEATKLDGSVVHEIGTLARESHADLIVLGSHGHGAMYDLLVGSTAQGVLKNAPCPVLIVPVHE